MCVCSACVCTSLLFVLLYMVFTVQGNNLGNIRRYVIGKREELLYWDLLELGDVEGKGRNVDRIPRLCWSLCGLRKLCVVIDTTCGSVFHENSSILHATVGKFTSYRSSSSACGGFLISLKTMISITTWTFLSDMYSLEFCVFTIKTPISITLHCLPVATENHNLEPLFPGGNFGNNF